MRFAYYRFIPTSKDIWGLIFGLPANLLYFLVHPRLWVYAVWVLVEVLAHLLTVPGWVCWHVLGF